MWKYTIPTAGLRDRTSLAMNRIWNNRALQIQQEDLTRRDQANAAALADRMYGQRSQVASQSAARRATYQPILDQLQQAMAQANAANEARYQQGMALYDENIAALANAGQQRKADIDAAASAQAANTRQDTVSRGLTGTTIAPALQRGVENDRVAAQNRLAEQIALAQNQARTAKAGFVERREDVAPDWGQYLALLTQMMG